MVSGGAVGRREASTNPADPRRSSKATREVTRSRFMSRSTDRTVFEYAFPNRQVLENYDEDFLILQQPLRCVNQKELPRAPAASAGSRWRKQFPPRLGFQHLLGQGLQALNIGDGPNRRHNRIVRGSELVLTHEQQACAEPPRLGLRFDLRPCLLQ